MSDRYKYWTLFYSHVNYSVTKINHRFTNIYFLFYSHVNYSVTKINNRNAGAVYGFTVT